MKAPQDFYVFKRCFRWCYATSPIATENRKFDLDNGYTAYTFIYIFGFRVVTIQRNIPWQPAA